jgi:hypothetical protein
LGHIALPPPPFPLTASFLGAEVRSARIYRSEHGGLLPDNVFWRYLEARWELDPGRFAHWHPRISPWIAEDYHLRHEPHTITPPPSTPPTVIPPAEPPPAENPPSVIVPLTVPPPVEIPPPVPSNPPPTGGGEPPPPPPPPSTNISGATPEPSSWILLATSAVASFLVSKFRKW